MPWVETEFDPEFKRWIEDFPQTHLPQIYELLNQFQDRKSIVIFKSRQEAEELLNGLSDGFLKE